MPDEIYELIAQGARYWFLFLMVLIVWRSWRWYRKDRRQARKRLKLLPDAGYVGEMIVLSDTPGAKRGTALSVPREGTLGFGRTNDLCVQAEGVAKRHLWFRFDDGRGLMVEPYRGNSVNVDGEDFHSRKQPLYMAHGSRLYVGGCELRLRLFAGFEAVGHAPRHADVQPEEPEEPQLDPAQQEAYEQWLRQQWLMQQYAEQAYQQGYEQAMAQQAQAAAQPQQPEEDDMVFDDAADVYTYEAAREQGLVDLSAFRRPAGEKKPEVPVYEESVPKEPFYAPVMEEEEEPAEIFYPPVTDEDDLTDAAAPPKSAYVGHDEAERAKREVWDRMFGGERR